MNIRPLEGYLILSRDPIDNLVAHDLLYAPDQSARASATGLCHIHIPGGYWSYWGDLEEGVTGRRILFERFAGRPFTIQEHEFWVIPETSVLAIEEKCMPLTRDQFITEVGNVIKDTIPENKTLDETDVAEIQGALDDLDDVAQLDSDADEAEEVEG